MSVGSLILDAAAVQGREVIPRIVTVPSPAAGAEWSTKPPAGSVWLIQTLTARLTTSAVVANRMPRVLYSDSDAEFYRLPQSQVVVASTVLVLELARGLTTSFGQIDVQTWSYAPLLPLPLLGSWQIGSTTTLIDVGDQWSAIRLYVLEIEETPYLVELARDVARLRSGRDDAVPQLATRG